MNDGPLVGYHEALAEETQRPESRRWFADREFGVARGASPNARLIALVLLSLVLFVAMMLSGQRAAFAVENPGVVAFVAQEKYGCPEDPNRPFEEGGGLCVSDWIGYLPHGIASIVIVLIVDGIALYIIIRRRQRGEEFA